MGSDVDEGYVLEGHGDKGFTLKVELGADEDA